ncbi:MAG: hypothetical protein GF355_02120 [Candidatus Eisenbacteria bacterium]|nr:hypothetical protein [Candidatus Eisenbacteria bacterium]
MRRGKSFAVLFALAAAVWLAVPNPAGADDTIFDIQLGMFDEGAPVTADSVVVTATGFWGFSVQEPEPHDTFGFEWSGIWVYTDNTHLGDVKRGDLISVSGTYEEYFDLSEIDITGGGSFTVISEDYPIPEPVDVLISEVNDTGVLAENYESVLIRVDRDDPTLYAREPDQYDEWYLSTDPTIGQGDSLLMEHISADPEGDFLYESPEAGTELEFSQGILTYNYDSYKLAPRDCNDNGGICKPSLLGAYSMGTASVGVQFSVDVSEATAEDTDNYELLSGYLVLDAVRDPGNHKKVTLTTETLPNGQSEQIIVSGVAAEDGGLVMDPNQTYNFRSGITSIYDIQYVDDPATEDASPLLDELVTIEGRITARDGNYYFLQEGAGGPWMELYCRVAASGDHQEGDLIRVAGEVREYFGLTQLGFRSGVNYLWNQGPDDDPLTITPVTAGEIYYSDPNLAPEPLESALVHLSAAYVDSSGEGTTEFGEWFLLQLPDSAACDLDQLEGYNHFYNPCVGDTLEMTGVLNYAFGEYRIAPRTDGDITVLYSACDPTGAPETAARQGLWLAPARPNPFTPSTTLRFGLPAASRVGLAVYGADGRLVRTLLQGKLDPGEYQVQWDGRTSRGLTAPAGVYFIRLSAPQAERSEKILKLQ